MKLADVFIRRPVFAVMLIAALVVFGLISYPRIGVDLYPNVEYPVVTVTVRYPGADPEAMESKVADPIEQAIHSMSGIKALRSLNMEGTSQITVELELEVALDRAVQDIRDRVSALEGELPDGVEAPVVQKFDVGAAPILSIALAGDLPPRELTQVADDLVKERVQRIGGVGGVELIGGRERELRVAVDASKLSGLGLTVQDVADAIRAQNVSLPAGSFDRGAHEITAKTKGEVKTAEDVADILLPGAGGGVRVRDVATVRDTTERARSTSMLDGRPAIALLVRKQSGANTVAVARDVRAALQELEPRLAERGVTLAIPTDESVYIAHSIHDVQFDLVFGALLAAAIILVFLRDGRATLISAVAIPTSVVGTFAFMQWLGFSFNNMTMLALSLSIGVLIDDAIVVIENIHRHLERGQAPAEAASNGAAQIFLAVLATTTSILAVFVPVATMTGIIGRFFYQFGVTVSIAVALSMLVSFTLTPMLSSRFLVAAQEKHASWPARVIDAALRATDRGYGRVVAWALQHRIATIAVALLALGGSLFAVTRVRTEYMPPEDRAQLDVQVELASGSSLSATTRVTEAIAADLRAHVPGIAHTFATVGAGAQGRSNLGQIQLTLVPRSQRAYSQDALMAWLRQRLDSVPNARVTVQAIAPMGGQASRAQPIQFYVRGADIDQLVAATDALKAELATIPGLVDVDTTYRGGKPELAIEIDRTAAASMGVSAEAVASTVRTLMAGTAVSEIKDGVDVADIVVQLADDARDDVEALANMQVRSSSGLPVDLSNIVHIRRGLGPTQIEREGRQRQITVLAGLQGLTLGEATRLVDAAAKRVVPRELDTGFVGMADTMQESFVAMGVSLLLAVIFVYMILAAQFDSFVHPLTIMLSLPLSLVGAFGALYAAGETLNVFSMIGVIMLMGLVTKNAILLVDFANQLRAEGRSVRAALVEAGVARLRPIVMTTAAMVFGMLPVALAWSEGGEVRAPMAICVIGGLLTSMLLTLVVVPVAYSLSESMVSSRPVQWLRVRAFGVAEAGTALLLLATLHAAPSRAQDALAQDVLAVQPGGLTAAEVESRALAASATLGERRARLEAANARIAQTRIQFYPQLGLRGSYTRLSPVETELGDGAFTISIPEDSYQASAQLSVPLSDYVLRLSDAAASASQSRDAAEHALRAEELVVRSQARILYLQWLRTHAQVGIAEQAVRQAQARLNEAQAAFDLGTLSRADLLKLEALVAQAQLAAERARTGRQLASRQLAIVMDDTSAAQYAAGEAVPAVEVSEAEVSEPERAQLEQALARRFELKALEASAISLAHAGAATRVAALPRLDAVGQVDLGNPNSRYFPPEQRWNATWQAGVVLSWNLTEAFGRGARSDELTAERAGILAQREALARAIVSEISDAQAAASNARAALTAGDTSLRSAEESYRVASESFRLGQVTASDVVDAETDLLGARLALLDARIDLATAVVRLRHALGRDTGS